MQMCRPFLLGLVLLIALLSGCSKGEDESTQPTTTTPSPEAAKSAKSAPTGAGGLPAPPGFQGGK